MYDSLAVLVTRKCYGREKVHRNVLVEGMRIDRMESSIITDKWFAAIIEAVNNMKFGSVIGGYCDPLVYADGRKKMEQILEDNREYIRTREDSIFRNRKFFGYLVVADLKYGENADPERAVACIGKDMKDVLWVQPYSNFLLWLHTIKYLMEYAYISHSIKYNLDNADRYFGGAILPFRKQKKIYSWQL